MSNSSTISIIRGFILAVCVVTVTHTISRAQCICTFPGDVDNSGRLDIGDLSFLVDFMFTGGAVPFSEADCPSPNRGDINCDLTYDISDLIYMVEYMFNGGPAPCNPCDDIQAPAGDNVSLDSLLFLGDNYFNAIFDSGVSVFVYTNQPGHTTESPTSFMLGDSLVEIVLAEHENDSAFMMSFAPVLSDGYESDVSPILKHGTTNGTPRTGSFTIPTTACENSSSSCNPQPIIISGNTVTMNGMTPFTFDSPDPLSPTLQERVSQAYNNPPPMLTPQQISTACGEGALTVGNYRISSVRFVRTHRWTSGSNSYVRQWIYYFVFENSWEYDCPSGPQKHKLFSEWQTSYREWINGGLTTSTYSTSLYMYTYP